MHLILPLLHFLMAGAVPLHLVFPVALKQEISGWLSSRKLVAPKEDNIHFDEQVALCREILQRKTKEYTGDDTDRLGAFKAAAALQHTTPERALAGMLAKHIVSLYDMCFDGDTDYDISTWNEKITDSLNYLFLLKAIVKEGHTNQPN